MPVGRRWLIYRELVRWVTAEVGDFPMMDTGKERGVRVRQFGVQMGERAADSLDEIGEPLVRPNGVSYPS